MSDHLFSPASHGGDSDQPDGSPPNQHAPDATNKQENSSNMIVPAGQESQPDKIRFGALEEENRFLKHQIQRLEARANLPQNQAAQNVLQALYSAAASGQRSYAQQARDMLDIGRHFLGMDISVISEITPENDQFYVRFLKNETELDLQEGQYLKFNETYCTLAFLENKAIGFADVKETQWLDHPCYKMTGLASYLGAPYYVSGERKGSIVFLNQEPRPQPFNEFDFSLIVLMTEWVGGHIERIEHQEQLKQLNNELDTFARIVSHDLKTPLATIIGFAEILAEQPDLPQERVNSLLAKIQQAGWQANDIIDSLSILSGMRNSDVAIVPINMAQLLRLVQYRLQIKLQDPDIELIVPEEWPQVLGYAPWVQMIWTNYLENALKYGGRPLKIELGFGSGQQPRFVRFWIKDNGPGLPSGGEDIVFNDAVRMAKGDVPGQGIGLFIVKRLVKQLGGEVGTYNRPAGGACFYFSLPLVYTAIPQNAEQDTEGKRDG